MVDVKKYANIDLYGLLGVEIGATENEIRKAYRKKALECHPDKNPDNPKAAELFHELASALEILSDESARTAYDRVLTAKKAAALRHQELDSKRRKLIEDLERREKEASERARAKHTGGYGANGAKSPEDQLKDEMERLRREGSRLIQEEQELLRQKLAEDRLKMQCGSNEWDSSKHRIKIKWKTGKHDKMNGGYDEDSLRNFMKKYGDIVALVVSSKKNGNAIIEFKTQEAAEMAVDYERGNMQNPLTLEWIGDAPSNSKYQTSGTVTDNDFESLVLRQLRQAEERRRLTEQMMREDAES